MGVNGPQITGIKIANVQNYFLEPVASTHYNMYSSRNPVTKISTKIHHLQDIEFKMVVLSKDSCTLFIPIIH